MKTQNGKPYIKPENQKSNNLTNNNNHQEIGIHGHIICIFKPKFDNLPPGLSDNPNQIIQIVKSEL